MHKVKTLGLVVATVFAVSVAPGSASANFDSTVESTSVGGINTNNHTLTTSVGTVSCKKATFSGSQKGTKLADGKFTAASISLSPVYTECTAFGFGGSVNMNGCQYQFTITGTAGTAGTPTGPVHIVCPPGKTIVYALFGCNFEIGAQTPDGHVGFMNVAGGDVEIDFTVTGVVYGGSCGSGVNGTLGGKAVLHGGAAAISVTGSGI